MLKHTSKYCCLKSLLRINSDFVNFEILDPLSDFVVLDYCLLNNGVWASSDFTTARNISLSLWNWRRLPSGLGKPGAGEEVFSQELWWVIKKEITSQSHGGIRHQCISLNSCPLYCLIPCPVQEFCSFLHNPKPRPKQSWEQLDSPWWLISSWRENPVGSNSVPSNSNLQFHFYVNFLEGCSSRFTLPIPQECTGWGLAQRFGSFLCLLCAASSCSPESTMGIPACAKAISCIPALLSQKTLSVHTKDTALLLCLGLGNL